MTKQKMAAKTAMAAAKHPHLRGAGFKAAKPAAKASFKVAKPIVKRQVQQRVQPIGETISTVSEATRTAWALLATYGPPIAIEFGLIEMPKPKRTAPRVIAGVVIGAGAMYFLDPEHGSERRQKVAGAGT